LLCLVHVDHVAAAHPGCPAMTAADDLDGGHPFVNGAAPATLHLADQATDFR
jgi:hypothetical protein